MTQVRVTGLSVGSSKQIRRPLLVRGHQAARSMLQSACPKSFQSFKSQVDNQVFIHFHSFPILQSAISNLPIWYQLLADCLSAFICLLEPTDNPVTTLGVCPLSPGPPRVPLKNHHISSLPPGPNKNQKKCTQGHQKTPKCEPNPSFW